MYCKNCGKEIAEGMKFCADCGTPVAEVAAQNAPADVEKPIKKKKKRHPVLGTILVIIGIFIFIGALLGGGEEEPEKVGEADPTISTEAPKTEFSVGDKVELNNIIVTLVSVTENDGTQYHTPADGKVFVICEFEIENNSNSEIAVSSLLSFHAYFDDYATQMSLSAMISSDIPQLDGSVAPGKKMHGVIGYEVDENWNSIDIRFTANFWAGRDFTFVYDKNA